MYVDKLSKFVGYKYRFLFEFLPFVNITQLARI